MAVQDTTRVLKWLKAKLSYTAIVGHNMYSISAQYGGPDCRRDLARGVVTTILLLSPQINVEHILLAVHSWLSKSS